MSGSSDKSVNVDYKYNLLTGRYAKRETNSNVKLVAVKVTNNSGRDLHFGKDIKLVYNNGADVVMLDNAKLFDATKQHPAIYLLYLLLTPSKLTTSSGNGASNSVPIGYAIGPGIAGGNIIAASSANSKYKEELLKYDIAGTVVKNGETVYGLVGISTNSFEGIKVKVADLQPEVTKAD